MWVALLALVAGAVYLMATAKTGPVDPASAASCWARVGLSATAGLFALGFTSVYREGFEVVLFQQNLKLQQGDAVVLEGVGIRLACTAGWAW